MSKLIRPRRHENKLELEMTIKDGKVNLLAKEGHRPLIKIKDQKYENINEILEMLNHKL